VPTPVPFDGTAPPSPVVVLDAADVRQRADGDGAVWRRVRRRMVGTAVVYTAGGSAFGLVAAVVWVRASGSDLWSRGLLTASLASAWLLMPTVLTVLVARVRTHVLVWVGYVALVHLSVVGTGAGPADVLVLLGIDVLPPAIGILALSGRNLRAVGPFLAVPVLLGSAGLQFSPWVARELMASGSSLAPSLVIAVVGSIGCASLGFAHLAWTAHQYATKRASDQVLVISQWWFLVAVWQSMLLVPSDLGVVLSAWAAYVVFRVVIAIGFRLLRPPGEPPLRLLLLRTFGAQRRSEQLLRQLGAHWRHLGPVQMIAGPDLVSAALDLHEFLDRLRGRLDRQFIGDAEELRQRLGDVDEKPDPDGRYRVNELFCHDNAWRPALRELLARSDCILLDVRGFTPEHSGATYEMQQLAQLVPLDRVLLIIDGTTHHTFLRATLDQAWHLRDIAGPTRRHGGWRLMWTPPSGPDVQVLVGQLAAAANSSSPGGPLAQGRQRWV